MSLPNTPQNQPTSRASTARTVLVGIARAQIHASWRRLEQCPRICVSRPSPTASRWAAFRHQRLDHHRWSATAGDTRAQLLSDPIDRSQVFCEQSWSSTCLSYQRLSTRQNCPSPPRKCHPPTTNSTFRGSSPSKFVSTTPPRQ